MKVVIDIPDYNLDDIQNGSIACGQILKAVKNGIPISTESDLNSPNDLKGEWAKGFHEGFKAGSMLADTFNERPQGEWFVNPHSMVMKCMNCGHEENAKDVGVVDKDKHFCYWCGADMRKGGAE